MLRAYQRAGVDPADVQVIAGAASLVKAAVAMTAGTIPPGTGCARPHPLIASGDALLRLPARAEPWPDGA